jgi:hypothetical protein
MNANKDILALPSDAARVLHCSPGKVVLLVDSGRLPVIGRTVRGVRVLRLADVERFAAGEREALTAAILNDRA